MSAEGSIRILPDLLVKKIAAGEVVERPASVVKELLENAVDAAATRIAITIEEGGKGLIRVTDDGTGITADQLRLAVSPHATSKILVEDDLYSITTMGFRGEALASISSVSKMRMVSRRRDAVAGHEIRIAAEQVQTCQAASSPVGTTVEVRDLFFNVPVRRKFLRSNSTETGHIHDQFSRIALVHPHIAFQLTSNGRLRQNLPACQSYTERIAKLYGPELASTLLTIERHEQGVSMEAYVAPPAQSRATAQWQYTFVNGRYIRDRFIQHAIKEAYRGLTEPHRHGIVFLFLVLDPRDVDVNVHPTKIEVRWAHANLIHSQVLSALRETFQRCDLTPALRTDRGLDPRDAAQQDRLRAEMATILKSTPPIQPGTPSSLSRLEDGRVGSASEPTSPSPGQRDWTRGMDADSMWRSLYGSSDASQDAAGPLSDTPTRPVSGTRPHAIQMHNLYLVAETDDGIVIVDQHALHERIIYEQLRERMTAGPLESQRLLLPETLTVTPAEAALIESSQELLNRLGIEASPFGVDSVAVHSFPALLKDTDTVPFMRDLLDYLAGQAADTGADIVINHILSMMACKAAVKAGDPLAPEEIDALFQQKDAIDKSSSCPHGRPTMLRLTKADLDRQFHRT